MAWIIASLHLLRWMAVHAVTGTEERSGLRCISSKPFPAPEGRKFKRFCRTAMFLKTTEECPLASLYLAQLRERLGEAAVKNVGY